MQTTPFVNVPHGLTFANIRNVEVNILNDAGNTLYSLRHSDSYTDVDGKLNWNTTNISLLVRAGGYFDSTFFNDTVMNRGYITIEYLQ